MKSSLLSLLLFFGIALASAQAQFTVNGPEMLCVGTSATLTATGCGGSLLWSTNATSASITVSPTTTTTYFVTCTVSGVKSVASISPVVAPNLTLSSNSGNCFSGSATLTANGSPSGTSFRWKKDGTLIPNATTATYNATQPGSYTVEPQAEAWTWQNPLPDGEDFNDVFFVDDNVGVAVGNYGKIVRTTDGGETWNVVPFVGKSNIYSVYFTSNMVGWIASNSDNFYKTNDGGLTWSKANLNFSTNYYGFYNLQFTDSNHGWMVGNSTKILRTTDGGATWNESDLATSVRSIFFTSNSIGWAVGYNGDVRKTTDGGATWSSVSLGTTNSFSEVFFVNSLNGWITGYNSLYKTTDGGNSWTNVNGNFPAYTDFKNIFFTDTDNGVLTTSVGIWKTTNAGISWSSTISPGIDSKAIFMRSNSKAWIVGRGGRIQKGFQGTFQYEWKTTRGEGYFISSGSGSALDFVNANVGWASNGRGYLLNTTNGGKVWKPTTLQLVDNVDFVDENVGYAVVQKSISSNQRGIYKSTNGGDSWNLQTDIIGGSGKIQFIDSSVGWATSGASLIYRTTDGGANWNDSNVGFSINSFFFLNANTGWVGGYNGQVSKTTNGGISWSSVSVGLSSSVGYIYFKNASDGYTSDNSTNKRTTDGGLTWTTLTNNPDNFAFTSLTFADANVGIALTGYYDPNFGAITTQTRDGGATWKRINLPTSYNPNKLIFSGSSSAWTINYNGGIMHYAAPASSCTSNIVTLTAAPAAPTITASNTDDVVCSGSSVTLTAAGCGGVLQWSTGATAASITVTPSASAIYTVFCKAGGCQSQANYSFGIVPKPVFSASSTNLCADENVQLSVSANGLQSSAFAWKRDGQPLANAGSSYFANQAGTYTVEDTLTLGTWVPYAPTPHNYSYRDVYFTDANTGYAVGDQGIIYKTTDAGAIWLPQNSGTTENFYGVQFTDANTGYVISQNSSSIFKTTNAGQSWNRINSNSNNYYQRYAQFFTSSSTGWTVGSLGKIEKTTDGGENWTAQSSGINQNLRKVVFIDANTGWIVGDNGTILKTTDGGQNWASQSSGTTQGLNAVQFINASEGWAVGRDATFLKTTNGGSSWTVSTVPNYYNTFNTLHFFNSNEGILAGSYGYARTSDGGNTFVSFAGSKYGDFNGVSFVNPSVGFGVGSYGRIAKTENAGISWQTYANDFSLNSIDDVSFSDENNGWGISESTTLVKSNDGGKSWVKASIQLSPNTNEYYYGLQFKNATTGWVCGSGNIYKTNDAGQNWVKQFAQNNKYLNDIFFLDTQIGWAVGYHYPSNSLEGYVLRTTDGGSTWQGVSLGNKDFQKVFFTSSSTGWMVGPNGTIYKTSDGGTNWSQQSSGISNQLSSIYFQDNNIGWIGGNGSLLKTQDGGNTWVSSFSNYISPVEIKIVNGIGWIIDYQSAYYTNNNGQTWKNSNYGGAYQQVRTGVIFPSGKMLAVGSGRVMKFFPKPTNCVATPILIQSAPAAPTVIASKAGSLCEGESITLTGSGCAGTLSWSNGSTAATITVTPYASTTYTAYCAGTNGCKSTNYTGVAVLPKVRLDTASTAPCNRPVFTASNAWQGIPLVWKKDATVFQTTTNRLYTTKESGIYSAEAEVAGLWASQNGVSINSDLRDVAFPTASVGFATGSRGEILKTSNGGLDWQTLQSGSTSYLNRIQMLDANTGFVVGDYSTFLKTSDGGTTWVKLKITGNSYEYFSDLSLINSTTGWVVGNNKIYYTSSGGINWTAQFSGGNTISAVHATSTSTAWAVGYSGQVLKTTNGGASWSNVNVGTTTNLSEVYFSDANHGWILGNDKTVLRTIDGGNTWTPSAPATTNSNSFYQAVFIDNLTGWLTSGNYFYKTTDGGISWTELPRVNSAVGYVSRVTMLNGSEGIFVGGRGSIARTTNGAVTWQGVAGNSKNYLTNMHFVNNTTGFVLGNDNTFMSTTDGGKKWIANKINLPNYYVNSYGIFFADASHGWIPNYNDLLKTTDGGVSWTKYTHPDNGSFYSVFFTSATIGYSSGNAGRIMKTTDGGNTWTPQVSSTTQGLQKIFFADASHGWAVGDNGTIVATNNAGANWTTQSAGTTNSFGSAHFNSINDGWATTYSSNGLYHTTNGGNTWTQVIIDPNGSTNSYRVQFTDQNTGFVLGNEFVFATTDGGTTWKKSLNHYTSGDMYFTDATHGWLVGSNGSILTYKPAPTACPSAPVTVQPQSIAPLSTLASGNWSSSSIWSCGTIPTALDAVHISQPHIVTLPTGYTAKAKSIDMLGDMQYGGNNAGLQMGQE